MTPAKNNARFFCRPPTSTNSISPRVLIPLPAQYAAPSSIALSWLARIAMNNHCSCAERFLPWRTRIIW